MSSHNRRSVTAAAYSLGAVRVEWEDGKKHAKYRVFLADGTVAHDTISQSRHDPYKVKGWVRQLINRARAAGASHA